jgi:hypothetical protein
LVAYTTDEIIAQGLAWRVPVGCAQGCSHRHDLQDRKVASNKPRFENLTRFSKRSPQAQNFLEGIACLHTGAGAFRGLTDKVFIIARMLSARQMCTH